jgi:hypothetical protein
MPDSAALALATAILYAARLQRRLPENERQKREAIAESLADATLILGAVSETLNGVEKKDMVPAPEQPPPSPGTIGRRAEAKAARRRG